jgi:lysophospholipase L1-like esterase
MKLLNGLLARPSQRSGPVCYSSKMDGQMRTWQAFTIVTFLAFSAWGQVPTVWVVGDSTANNANRRGWGDPLASYFDQERVRTVNRARAGRSSRTFVTEGLWENVRRELKPGDYVLLQMGHNDGGLRIRTAHAGRSPAWERNRASSPFPMAAVKWSTRSGTTCGR